MPSHGNAGEDKTPIIFGGLMIAVGVVYSVLFINFFPGWLSPSNFEGFPLWINVAMRALLAAQRWPWGLLTIAVLFGWVFASRFRNQWWTLAIAIGAVLGRMMMQALGK